MTNEQKAAALREVLDGIVDAVKVAGSLGAPGGVLYAALMASGCTLNQFHSLMGYLVRKGELVKRGECYLVPAAA